MDVRSDGSMLVRACSKTWKQHGVQTNNLLDHGDCIHRALTTALSLFKGKTVQYAREWWAANHDDCGFSNAWTLFAGQDLIALWQECRPLSFQKTRYNMSQSFLPVLLLHNVSPKSPCHHTQYTKVVCVYHVGWKLLRTKCWVWDVKIKQAVWDCRKHTCSSGECAPVIVGPYETASMPGTFSPIMPHSRPAWMAATFGSLPNSCWKAWLVTCSH